MKGRFHPAAEAELEEAAKYYAEVDPALGMRFYREIERLVRDVCLQPDRFRQFKPPVRRHFSTEFPYALIYLPQPEYVWIVAVMHMKRAPDYWRTRIK